MEEQKSEAIITEVKILDPYDPKKSDDDENSVKTDSTEEICTENVDLVYKKPPRLFRSSLIHKSKQLFVKEKYRDDGDETDDSKPLKANISWFIIMGVGSLLAFSVIDKAWQRFQGNPMITNLVINDIDKEVVYPTVTVCPENSADMGRIDNFLINFGLYNKSSQELNQFLAAIPNFSYDPDELKYVILLPESRSKIQDLEEMNLRNLAFEFALSCADIFKPRTCSFRSKSFDCCKYFLPLYTELGFCYSFNSKIYSSFFGKTYRE